MTGDPAETVRRWLRTLGDITSPPAPARVAGCPFLDWAASGAMELTGAADGPPVLSPGPMTALLRESVAALAHMTGPFPVDPVLVLSGRAGAMNLTRRGRTSVGGATRLLRASDGWCAVTLSRPDDLELVPAMLGRADLTDPWQELTKAVRGAKANEFADHIRMFGVPAAALPPEPPSVDVPWQVSTIAAPEGDARRPDGVLVVDLSSLWAGPLCARLLGLAGARVVKVESTRRPDGARSGSRRFYDWLHAGHESVAVDFTLPQGRSALADLVSAADVVIEASRPRALAQLGLAPERLDHRAGKVWVSITGYGRGRPDRVAFGDDAAVAGGLVGRSADGEPVFCADAVADPLTGVVAALGAMGALACGGGQLIDVSMRNVAAAFATAPRVDHGPHPVRRAPGGSVVECPALGRTQEVLAPRAPVAERAAPAMGADTARILSRVAELRGRSAPR